MAEHQDPFLNHRTHNLASEFVNFSIELDEVDTQVQQLPQGWASLADDVILLDKKVFEETAIDRKYYDIEIDRPGTLLVTQHFYDDLIGYTMGVVYEECFSDPQYKYIEGDLYIFTTLIDEPFREQGLLAKLMDTFESTARDMGYSAITRHAAKSNGYSDKIRKHYKDRIVESYLHTCSFNGEQEFFRITL